MKKIQEKRGHWVIVKYVSRNGRIIRPKRKQALRFWVSD